MYNPNVFQKKGVGIGIAPEKKLDSESGQKIFLYKHGVFWTAYEQSALILRRHKQLKLSIKFVKTVNQQVVNVGFSDATLEGIG